MNDYDRQLKPIAPKRITTYRDAMERIHELELMLRQAGAWIDGRYLRGVAGTKEPAEVRDEIKAIL